MRVDIANPKHINIMDQSTDTIAGWLSSPFTHTVRPKRRLLPRCRSQLAPVRLATYRNALARDRNAGTVNQYLHTLSHTLSVAVRERGWFETNPAGLQYLPESRGRVRFLDEGERSWHLVACRASDNRMFYPKTALEQEAAKRIKPGSAVSRERQLDVYRDEVLQEWFADQGRDA